MNLNLGPNFICGTNNDPAKMAASSSPGSE